MKNNAYTKHVSENRAETIHEVTLPSGFVWKLGNPPIQQFIAAGKLPASLTAKLAVLAKDQAAGKPVSEILQSFSPDEFMHTLEFGRDMLMHCAVDPKISLDPQNENEVDPIDILPEDFSYLINWVMSGGDAGENLSTFPVER